MTCLRIPLPALLLTLACTGAPASDDEASGSSSGEASSGETSSGEASSDSSDSESAGQTETETGEPPLACNGHVELCARRLDEVAFAGTHNSHASSEDGFSQFNANQVHGVATQLDAGIRVLLMDTYYADDDSIVLCHGPCNLGETPHVETLQTLVDFLVAHPGEIIVIIYQDDVSGPDLELDYQATGADALVYTHPSDAAWPTLGELVAADTRLIVTVEAGGPPPAWHQNVWDLAWDTPYGPMDPAELSCALNRGSTDNDLFLVNHWVNNELDLPSAQDAEVVNQYEFLLARAQACEAMWDHIPNFVAVDFYDKGDVVGVVETLNGF
jgi:hypothetical protein